MIRSFFFGVSGSYFARVFRYAVSGTTAAVVHLGLIYILTEWIGLWYLFSSTIAFVCAFFVSFALQKFWTFSSKGLVLVRQEFFWYGCIAIWNGALNIGLLYIGVEVFKIPYIIGQGAVIIIVASQSFFLYRRVFLHDLNSNPGL